MPRKGLHLPSGARSSQPTPAPGGARRLRGHLRLVPRRLPALRRRQRDGGRARDLLLAALPVLLAVRYVLFAVSASTVNLAFRNGTRPGRHRRRRRPLVPITAAIVAKTQSLRGFPLEIFVVDALLATLVAGRDCCCGCCPDSPRAGQTRAGAGADRRCRPLGPRPRARARRDPRPPRGRLPRRQSASAAGAVCSA